MPILLSLALATGQASSLPLPDHTDIPDGFSMVLCPNQDAAKLMLDRYHDVKPAPNNHTSNIELFFAGLKATGCSQAGVEMKGTITITQVMQRKTLPLASGEELLIRYSGIDPQGKPVAGIVNEDGNNGFARTDLAEWTSQRATDGWLNARGTDPQNLIFYRCSTAAAARNVVAQASKGKTEKAFRSLMKQGLEKEKCRPARDRYFVLARLQTADMECGDECVIELNALEAQDRSGLKVGLVFDGSLM